jgi:serine phosphatase RsbU (regulator of sigma subunit)/anti-sigma regulatory factor (Ser/Thr protein kinase)
MSKDRNSVERGSWRWAAHVAELMAWATVALIFASLHSSGVDPETYRQTLPVVAALGIWLIVFFHLLLFRQGAARWIAWTGVIVHTGFATAIYWLLRGDVGSVQLIFVPVILATGLVGGLVEALAASVLAVVGFIAVAFGVGPEPNLIPAGANAAIYLLSGTVAGLLARELRDHYRGEQREQRAASTVRHRLFAVLDSVDEGIVYRDRQGMVRVINQRGGEMFGIDGEDYVGGPVIELLRTVARQTEDPEDFLEEFQKIRDDPTVELRMDVDQLLPARRRLSLYSRPTFDDDGALVGRIDVFADITENVRRAAEVERLLEQARRTAENYQRGLLPESIPSLPRLSLVAHYVPAAGRRAICGDFYDFIHLADGKLALVLGDVVGIGPKAATDAALTRYTLRSLALNETDPAALLEEMNTHLFPQCGADRFVRLLIAVIDPERAQLTYSNAGHVPPVLYRAKSATVDWLEEGGIVLGVEKHATFKSGHLELDPGDMLVMYTDGVTEASRDGRPYGQGKFKDLIELYGVGTPGELAQALRRSVEAWVATDPDKPVPEGTIGELRDDIAILAVQVALDRTLGEPARELVLPNEPSRVSEVRGFVSSFLADLRAPVDVSTEILLAVGEAAANANRHGHRPDGRGEVRVYCALEGPSVTIVVADDGGGFDPSQVDPTALPDRFASGGRGMFLMRELMDEVEIESTDSGTTVTMYRKITAPKA